MSSEKADGGTDIRSIHNPIQSFDKLDLSVMPFEPTRSPIIYDNVLQVIGSTPLIRLKKIEKMFGLDCELLAKCEFMNPGGSLKDRIALRMVENAEKKGLIRPGVSKLVEPSSGNTGIAVALVASIKDYECTVVMTKKMSAEKERVMHALGTKVIRGDVGKLYGEKGNIQLIADEIEAGDTDCYQPCQYTNPYNPFAHYEQTAEEILYDCQDNVSMVVIGTGTGGTLTGISRKMKERIPECIVIGVDPVGSVMGPDCKLENFSFFEVEGVGHDYKPHVLNNELVDEYYNASDKDSFEMARRIIRHEGLFVGGSSGSTVWAAIQACKKHKLKKGDRCVAIMGDSLRNYMTKFLDDDWMKARNYDV